MHRGDFWPIAKGGEGNVLSASLLLGLATLLRLLFPSRLTKLLWLLITPVWLLVLYFFRDPDREALVEEGLVLSPADGEIVAIVSEPEPTYLHTDMVRISIFLSVMDVHVQRAPFSGTVGLLHHKAGQFLQAFKPEASEVNEYIAMRIDNPQYGSLLVKQIAGILARRCVNHMAVGESLTRGDRFGVIRFSSRVDLFLPPGAHLLIDIGDKVYGGMTPIARLEPTD